MSDNLQSDLAAHCMKLEKQRDELLAALKALMQIESRGRIMPIGKEWDDARSGDCQMRYLTQC